MLLILKNPLVSVVLDFFDINTVPTLLSDKQTVTHIHLISFLKLSINLCNRMRILNTYCLDPSSVF